MFIDFISMGNDQEIEFQEIEVGVFQEIRALIRRSKVFFIRRLKLFPNDQEIKKALGGSLFPVFLT